MSISLGLWWTVMGLSQAKQIYELEKKIDSSELVELRFYKQSRMIKMEGSFFILLLVIGGSTLLLLTQKEQERSRMLKDFFATLTHEMKTPLASLRLQAESLEEEIKNKKVKILVSRLIDDSKRLELQMDKALYLASINRGEILFLEKINSKDFFYSLKLNYPQIEFEEVVNTFLEVDRRALESIFKNIIENALHHGKASKIHLEFSTHSDFLEILIKDNGIGFSGDRSKLGKLFFRHTSSSGSGIGTYLICYLVDKMRGKWEYLDLEKGFGLKILLPIWNHK
jgi:signal transduction histidine kinase